MPVDDSQLAQLPEANPLPVLLCTEDGSVVYGNPAAESFLRTFSGEIERLDRLLPPEFRDLAREPLASGQTRAEPIREVHGRLLTYTYAPIRQSRRVFVVIVDETEHVCAVREARRSAAELAEANRQLHEAQSRMVHTAKMTALGSLVAGVAHELNSPLGALRSNNDTAMRCLVRIAEALEASPAPPGDDEKIRKLLSLAIEVTEANRAGLDRTAAILASLRTFARIDRAARADVDLHEGLDSAVALLAHETQRGVRFERDYRLEKRVWCAPGELNHVFMNLLINAVQALPGPGKVVIATAEVDGMAVVSITDSGVGIPPENLPRIFDPGFTTRGVGVGLGLGLSTAAHVIQAHCGRIEAQSRPGEGSTFRLILPIAPGCPLN